VTTAIDRQFSLNNVNEFFQNIAITTSHQPASTVVLLQSLLTLLVRSLLDPSVVTSLLKKLDVRKSCFYFLALKIIFP